MVSVIIGVCMHSNAVDFTKTLEYVSMSPSLIHAPCNADKQSGVVLRAPFLETVLQQVWWDCSKW